MFCWLHEDVLSTAARFWAVLVGRRFSDAALMLPFLTVAMAIGAAAFTSLAREI